MNVRRVPAGAANPREYIDGANRAFGQWGDESTFAWAFRDGAELLFIDGGGRPLAASGINWRTLRTGQDAAIITGSWTLPEARGRGLFARLIDASCEIARERNALTLGFVRAENVSTRGLVAAGAQMCPTFYCRSVHSAGHSEDLDTVDVDSASFASSFAYSPDEWRQQFLNRPNAQIECVGRRGEWSAVIERTNDFDRVHAVSDRSALSLLAVRAHAAGRRLFWYATRQPAFACQWSEGFLGVMPSSPLSEWEFQNGDRM